MSKNLYQDKEWREMRANHLKDACEVCGSTDRLSLHHKRKVMKFHEILYRLALTEITGKGYPEFAIELPFKAQAHIKANKERLYAIAKEISAKQREYYLSGADTKTLCISCHWKVEHGEISV